MILDLGMDDLERRMDLLQRLYSYRTRYLTKQSFVMNLNEEIIRNYIVLQESEKIEKERELVKQIKLIRKERKLLRKTHKTHLKEGKENLKQFEELLHRHGYEWNTQKQ